VLSFSYSFFPQANVFHTARVSEEKKLLCKVAELEAELATSHGKTEAAEQSVTRLEDELAKDHAAHYLKVAELEAELEAAWLACPDSRPNVPLIT
jgi:hypothetical protein